MVELSSQLSGTIQPAFTAPPVGGIEDYKSLISKILSPPSLNIILLQHLPAASTAGQSLQRLDLNRISAVRALHFIDHTITQEPAAIQPQG